MKNDAYRQLAKQMNGLFDYQSRATEAISRQILESVTSFTSIIPAVDFCVPRIESTLLIRALDLSLDIEGLVRPALEWRNTLTQQIQDMTRSLDSLSQRIIADLTAASLTFQEILATDIFDDLFEFLRVQEDAADAFKAAGWPIAPSMPTALRDRVVRMHQAGRTRYISRSILAHYQKDGNAHLICAVRSWRGHALFAPRMRIIEDALQAHCDGRYTLSVPALAPQIEGILSDYVLANNLPAKFGKIKEVYRAVIGDPDARDLATWAIANTLLYQLQTSTYAFTDFEAELRKSINSRKTTRHTVLHGIAPGYDKPVHSLRIFLLLDAISALQEVGK